jgi:hypothetical protein
MEEIKNKYTSLVLKNKIMRPLGRPHHRWKLQLKMIPDK